LKSYKKTHYNHLQIVYSDELNEVFQGAVALIKKQPKARQTSSSSIEYITRQSKLFMRLAIAYYHGLVPAGIDADYITNVNNMKNKEKPLLIDTNNNNIGRAYFENRNSSSITKEYSNIFEGAESGSSVWITKIKIQSQPTSQPSSSQSLVRSTRSSSLPPPPSSSSSSSYYIISEDNEVQQARTKKEID